MMITRDDELNVGYGLPVLFDGSRYEILLDDEKEGDRHEYPIGALICEYMRINPFDIKKMIMSCDGKENAGDDDGFLDTFNQFREKLKEAFPPVARRMIDAEFVNKVIELKAAERENQIQGYLDALTACEKGMEKIKSYVFENTGYEDIGNTTVLQVLLTVYWAVMEDVAPVQVFFEKFMECDSADDESNRQFATIIADMYGKNMVFQDIEYRLILLEGQGFKSLYIMKSSFSLLAFEMANVISSGTKIVKCKNCGNYFIPEGRSDTVYCSYPLRNNSDKTCKDVGAQIARANKEKTDELTREYRKVYIRYKMQINRHPEDLELPKKLRKLTEGFQERKGEILAGRSTKEAVLEWLKSEF